MEKCLQRPIQDWGGYYECDESEQKADLCTAKRCVERNKYTQAHNQDSSLPQLVDVLDTTSDLRVQVGPQPPGHGTSDRMHSRRVERVLDDSVIDDAVQTLNHHTNVDRGQPRSALDLQSAPQNTVHASLIDRRSERKTVRRVMNARSQCMSGRIFLAIVILVVFILWLLQWALDTPDAISNILHCPVDLAVSVKDLEAAEHAFKTAALPPLISDILAADLGTLGRPSIEDEFRIAKEQTRDLNCYITLQLSFMLKATVLTRDCSALPKLSKSFKSAIGRVDRVMAKLRKLEDWQEKSTRSIHAERMRIEKDVEAVRREATASKGLLQHVSESAKKLGGIFSPTSTSEQANTTVKLHVTLTALLDIVSTSEERLDMMHVLVHTQCERLLQLQKDLNKREREALGMLVDEEAIKDEDSVPGSSSCSGIAMKLYEEAFLRSIQEFRAHDADAPGFERYYNHLCDGERAFWCTSTAQEQRAEGQWLGILKYV